MHPYPGNWVAIDVGLCIIPRLPTHLVQELNVGSVVGLKLDAYFSLPIPFTGKFPKRFFCVYCYLGLNWVP